MPTFLSSAGFQIHVLQRGLFAFGHVYQDRVRAVLGDRPRTGETGILTWRAEAALVGMIDRFAYECGGLKGMAQLCTSAPAASSTVARSMSGVNGVRRLWY